MKPLLIGESNPYGHDPAFALYPLPEGCAGHRLCHVILGMAKREYLATFDRVNLLDGPKWGVPAARAAAVQLCRRGQPLILLGVRVAKAFGVDSEPFRRRRLVIPADLLDVNVLILPHPSGRCRVWNEPGAVNRARRSVRELLGALP